jgi:hypothetical protein
MQKRIGVMDKSDQECFDNALVAAESVRQRIIDTYEKYGIGWIKESTTGARSSFGNGVRQDLNTKGQTTNEIANSVAAGAMLSSYQHCIEGSPPPPLPTKSNHNER